MDKTFQFIYMLFAQQHKQPRESRNNVLGLKQILTREESGFVPSRHGAEAPSRPRSTISLPPGEEPGRRWEPGGEGSEGELQRVTVGCRAGSQTPPRRCSGAQGLPGRRALKHPAPGGTSALGQGGRGQLACPRLGAKGAPAESSGCVWGFP